MSVFIRNMSQDCQSSSANFADSVFFSFGRCSLQAIYWILRELAEARTQQYDGSVDNLLFFYAQLFDVVQETYRQDPSKRSKLHHKKSEGYLRS
jgi:hypothetical protein